MKVARLGKPLCIGSWDGRKCRRVGSWLFRYLSMGKQKTAYYCERCAASHSYEVFGQLLLRA